MPKLRFFSWKRSRAAAYESDNRNWATQTTPMVDGRNERLTTPSRYVAIVFHAAGQIGVRLVALA